MSFNQYLRESLDEFDFDAWLKRVRSDLNVSLNPLSDEDESDLEIVETLLDTQENVSEYIYANYPNENGTFVLLKLLNGEEV